jgi:hypothetical protein
MEQFILHLEKCFILSQMNKSKLTSEALKIIGLTGNKLRHFFNNLCSIENVRMLELGANDGAITGSSMFNNKTNICSIDGYNYINSSCARHNFLSVCRDYKGLNNLLFIEEEFLNVNISSIKNFSNSYNILAYDNINISLDKILEHYKSVLDETFILIVFHWNNETIQRQTLEALRNDYEIQWGRDIKTPMNMSILEAIQGWWDGMAVFVIKHKIQPEAVILEEPLILKTPFENINSLDDIENIVNIDEVEDDKPLSMVLKPTVIPAPPSSKKKNKPKGKGKK